MAIEIIIKGVDNASDVTAKVSGSIREMGDTATSQGSRISGFFGALKTGILAAGAGVAVGLGAIGASGLGMNNTMEQVSAKLNAFTKDSAVTKDLLAQINTEASTTPFAFQEMANATAALMSSAKGANVPVMDLVKQAEILAASNPAQGLEGAAIALKEAAGGDLTSIIERFDLPRQRLNELKAQGVPALEAVGIAMKEMGLDADLVTNMAGTMQGRWSTFQDTLTNLAAQLTQPIFDALSSGLAGVQTQLDANMPAIQAFATGLATDIGGAINWMITTGVPALVAGWQSIQPALAAVQAAFAEVMTIIGPLAAEIINQIPAALAQGQEAFTQLGTVVQERMAAIQAVISAVLPIITAFWAENGASIMETVRTTFTTIVAIITDVSAIINQLMLIIAGFMEAHGEEITAILSAAWQTISGIITTALNLISGIVHAVLQLLKGDFAGAWETIQGTAAEFVTGLLNAFQSLGTLLMASVNLTISAIQDAFGGLVTSALDIGKGVIDGIISGISGGVGALTDAISDAANAALDAAKKALGISSPSRVFAELVGLPIAQGMAQGVNRGMPLVTNAGANLAYAATAGAMAASQGTQRIEGRIGVDLSMNGGIEKMIDARIGNALQFTAGAASARKLGTT